ncbi:hypothetical protein B0H19DRAFT_1267401 [Mycena capillaripes]|nr:hypothetical protein B0H19DRAFT_1267401 [Mycena capillaripes]
MTRSLPKSWACDQTLTLEKSLSWRGEPTHVLLSACKITSSMLHDELKIINRDQQVWLGITLFGDGGASLVLSLDLGDIDPVNKSPKAIYELVNWSPINVLDTPNNVKKLMAFKPNISKLYFTPNSCLILYPRRHLA